MDYELMSAMVACEKANTVADFMEAMEYIDLREAELRAFSEGADMDTLVDYYEEATSANAEKKAGIIKRAWDAIVRLCSEVMAKISGVFKRKQKVDPKKKISINPKDWEIRETIASYLKKWGSHLSNLKDPKTFAKAAAALVITLGAIAGIKKKVFPKGQKKEVTAKDVESKLNLFQKAAESIKKGVNGLKNTSPSDAAHNARTSINSLLGAITGQTAKLVAEYDKALAIVKSIEEGSFGGLDVRNAYEMNKAKVDKLGADSRVARVLNKRNKKGNVAGTVMGS